MKKKEDIILINKILDKYKMYKKSGRSSSTNFLDARELKIVCSELNKNKVNYNIYEPYSFLEKKIIYFGDYESFLTYYKVDISNDITHKDILGSLFSIGIDVDLIGDIFVEDGYFYYVNLSKMNKVLENDFIKIKNQYIKLNKVSEIILTKNHFEEMKVLVSSKRLDTVVSKIINKSRSESSDMIKEGKILLNYEELKSINVLLKKGDILSIRGHGKYRIDEEIGLTKKNNIILKIYKYI